MKNTLLFFLLLFSFSTAYPQVKISSSSGADEVFVASKQDTLDICVLKAQYRMEYFEDAKNPAKRKNYFMLLQIGKKTSKFSDYFGLKVDSMHAVYARQKMSFSEVVNRTMPMYIGTSTLNVFKNYPKDKVTVTDRAALAGNFKYSEDKINFKWKLQQGSATICGYRCKKATTTFRGRNYTAWYAPDIPNSDGPWKFSGLPGLILKVSDDTDDYSFVCVAIEKQKSREYIYMNDKNYFKTTRERFNITAKNAIANPEPYAESIGVNLPKKKTRLYNPIELE
ncbi:MAG: GLPGLI family protein [Paludibacteraceae bacterium]